MGQEFKNMTSQTYGQDAYVDETYLTDVVQSLHPAFAEEESHLLDGFGAVDQGYEKSVQFIDTVSSVYTDLGVEQSTALESIYHDNPSAYIEAMQAEPFIYEKQAQLLGDGSEESKAMLLTDAEEEEDFDVEALWSGNEMLVDYSSNNVQAATPLYAVAQPQSHYDDVSKGGYMPEGLLEIDLTYTSF